LEGNGTKKLRMLIANKLLGMENAGCHEFNASDVACSKIGTILEDENGTYEPGCAGQKVTSITPNPEQSNTKLLIEAINARSAECSLAVNLSAKGQDMEIDIKSNNRTATHSSKLRYSIMAEYR
jgi:hypothetical protein